MARPSPYANPANYINRELSWLAFNRRVLEEAQSQQIPLLERVKFLAITASNLDEFVEVRLAGLLQRIEDGAGDTGPDGLLPQQEREQLVPALHEFVADQYRCWNRQLRPQLVQQGVCILSLDELTPRARKHVAAYIARDLDPLLTPITVDPAHPLPRVLNKALCLAFLLRRRGRRSERLLGVVTVPRALPRLIRLPAGLTAHPDAFVYIAHLVAWHARAMYRGFAVEAATAFRVTRNSNLYLSEEESRDLLETVRIELHNRRKGNAVRLEIEQGADPEVIERLRLNFELEPWQVFSTPGPVHLSRLITLYDKAERPDLKFPPFVPPVPPPTRIFAELRAADCLLHHPYESFEPVVRFIADASADPRVLSIKQTLYRTSHDSPILKSLIAAAAQKEVAVVVELKARFDENVNIRWARRLEDAGVQVSYGAMGRKTHCKLALIVRHDEDGALRRYLHLGTGNYNQRTAALYSDFSLLTARADLTAAAHAVFGYLTAGAEPVASAPLLLAPLDLAPKLIGLIEREAAHARRRRPARIIIKVNGLLDGRLIAALYAASNAGVKIDLLVRGVCALRPGRPRLSRNITVRSLVGRFLEHSRIYYFANNGGEELYLGSADGMPRNLYERVEILFPVFDAGLRRRLRDEVLAAYLADVADTRWLDADGNYRRSSRFNPELGGAPGSMPGMMFSAQEFFMACSQGRATPADIPSPEVGP